ncbi:MAG: MMPL family transporter [Clostridia bacterium]|nr:MMPL family transporter [Clostridia bacterium]
MIDKIASAIGRFCYRFRIVLSILGVIIFAVVIYTESLATITYTNDAQMDYIMDEFPEDTLVVIYTSEDEDKVVSIVSDLEENDPYVAEVQGYYNTLGLEMTASEMYGMMESSGMEGLSQSYIEFLYYLYETGIDNAGTMTLYNFINFVGSDEFLENDMVSSMTDEDSLSMITEYKDIINDIHDDTPLTASEMGNLFGISSFLISMLYGQNEKMTISEFLEATSNYSSMLGSYADTISQYQTLVTMIKNDTAFSPSALAAMLSAMTAGEETSGTSEEGTALQLDAGTITLLYHLYGFMQADMSDVTVPMYDFFLFVCDDVVTNDAFASLIPSEYTAILDTYKTMMVDNKAQLQGDTYSRVVLTINYVPESDEIYNFYETLNEKLADANVAEYYLVGSTAMSYELSLTFHSEYMLISILTAVVIFIVVCLTFRKFSVAAFLVCIIECAVFVTMSVMAAMGSSMYFIALMMVQCILMGSMVDYGILLSSYYREIRRTLSKKDALPEVMKKSITAIITSALIMICVCFIISFTISGAIASILRILGIGCLSALILIIFFLPALLSVSDKLLTKSWKDIKPFREARKARKNGTAAPVEDTAEPADAASEDNTAPDAESAADGDAEPVPQEN